MPVFELYARGDGKNESVFPRYTPAVFDMPDGLDILCVA